MVNMIRDRQTLLLFAGILALLVVATLIGQIMRWRRRSDVVDNLNARIKAWWVMSAVFAISLLTGGLGSVILFGLLSFFALREFITLTPTRPADHSALFWVFFIILPLQYYLVATQWYGFFSVLIPVYAFLFIPSRIAISGDPNAFLERSSKIQWGLMVCVYCVSHVPALLMLEIPGYAGKNARLLFFLVVIVQLSDVLQYVWGKLFGKHRVAPHISPSKTWEGLLGGVLSASALGACLAPLTPFSVSQAAGLALLIAVLGFFGGIVMSAIKRERGIKDWGTLIEGHGGMLDRMDSLCFSAPVYFHVLRY
ncbi:MAG TPA: phosphatidate cytidylyltransferase, partial [Thermoanaerobaculia bacterium]|nr:phosphatidate cytidylyltransferase [Thermoanaerobaculia bacterium]